MMLAFFGSTFVCEQTFSVEHQQSRPQIKVKRPTPQIHPELQTLMRWLKKETNNTAPIKMCVSP